MTKEGKFCVDCDYFHLSWTCVREKISSLSTLRSQGNTARLKAMPVRNAHNVLIRMRGVNGIEFFLHIHRRLWR